jgi:hypothetical protein
LWPTRRWGPNKVRAYELGYRSQATRTSSVDVALFYNVYDDLKVFAPAGSTASGAPVGTSFRLSTHQNQMRGESYGLEVSARNGRHGTGGNSPARTRS